jgi:hypothetical protein
VLSGDGSAAFAVTASNRVIRIEVASGQSAEIVPATPYPLRNINLTNSLTWTVAASRGQVTAIGGSGFAVRPESAVAPFPATLGGVELRAGGTTIPIAAVGPDSVSFPAPWDLPDAPVDVEVWSSAASASPFIPGFRVVPVWPSLRNPRLAGERFFTCTPRTWGRWIPPHRAVWPPPYHLSPSSRRRCLVS